MNMIKKAMILCFMLCPLLVTADVTFKEGQNYTSLSNAMRAEGDPHKVQVLLFFNYGCSACAKLEPKFEKWADSQDGNSKLVIYRYPVGFDEQWTMLSKLYFVMQDIQPKRDLNLKIFNAVHQQDLKLWHEDAMRDFFIANGYSGDNFDRTYNSLRIEQQLKNSQKMADVYAITVTPTIIINGKSSSYSLDIDQADDNIDKLFKILNNVVAREVSNM